MLSRAIVAFQPDHGRAGEVALKAQDVVDLGSAPAIDRLIVIADAADILTGLGQQPQPQILGDVGVLILVHQHIAEPLVIFGQHIRMLGEQGQVVQQQVAEIAGVQHAEAVLIEAIDPLALIVTELGAFAGGHLIGGPAPVLPMVDQAVHQLGRPALGVDIFSLEHLFDQPFLIVGVDDGVGGFQPDQLGMLAEDLGGDRMEGAQPAQPLGLRADQVSDPLAHLARRLVGEGDGQDFPRPSAVGRQDVGQPGGQDPRLARAGARQHQNRPVRDLDRTALFRIESGQIVVAAARHGGAINPGKVTDAR